MEAVVILLVPLVALAVYLTARFQAQTARPGPAAEAARLRAAVDWHEQRLRTAREKKWDAAMIDQITEQLAETEHQLARLNGAQAAVSRRNPAS